VERSDAGKFNYRDTAVRTPVDVGFVAAEVREYSAEDGIHFAWLELYVSSLSGDLYIHREQRYKGSIEAYESAT
jgi:hypothetical protein